MQPFSAELLTILVLVCLSLVGVTFIAVLIILIIFLCSKCIKPRQSKLIKPIRTPSTISIDNHSPIISPVPIRNTDQHQKLERKTYHYDANSAINGHSNKNKYQQQEYMSDENDETTTTMNESRMYTQRHQKRPYQSLKPIADIRIMDRNTPYPPDVIAREKLMNNTRFPTDDKY
jgi:hypothetical protein